MASHILNFNVGILGHVDSGKTSLVKSLSTVASTACFDKNPQSKERGVTLDLGFSSLCVDFPGNMKGLVDAHHFEKLQFTLVDCPGHASLIRTIIGGAQIIDLMILVIDIVKGIQTQTAECLVIGEITCNKMIIVLNKMDLIPENKRKASIEKMCNKIRKALGSTKFANSPIVPVSAKPGGSDDSSEPVGIQQLIEILCEEAYIPKRSTEGSMVFCADHCFSIKGQGTVLTGTVIQGGIAVNDTVEIPSLNIKKKVKSMQMFRKPVEKVKQGDRAGICVTQFDPKLLERGIVCTPDYMAPAFAVIAEAKKINYFKSSCVTKSKFHISIFHETVLARCSFFSTNVVATIVPNTFDYTLEYKYLECLESSPSSTTYVLLEFDHPVPVNQGCLYIGSRLDSDVNANICRLAFHGTVLEVILDKQYQENILPKIKIFKVKNREGLVERMVNDQEVIIKNLFKKETNIQIFSGLKVTLSTGETGIIESGFGQSGKAKIRIIGGLDDDTKLILSNKKKERNKEETTKQGEPIKIKLEFKRYVYDPKKKIIQN